MRALRVRRSDGGEDATANFPHRFDGHSSRRKNPHEIIEDGICDGLVEGTFVTVGPDVHLEAFEFNEKLVRHIGNANGREIRLTCDGTDASQFIGFAEDLVIATLFRVRDSDEFL